MHQKTAKYDFSGNRKHCEISQRRQAAWIHAIKRKDWSDKLTKYGRVCSRLFNSGEPASLREETHPDWVLSINMGYEINHGNSHVCDRYKRLQTPRKIKLGIKGTFDR
ncbi:hypothetical protein JTB14_007651 [Gonioctena quinquepunctata]|nr:hypothetical protein JTB14_007651 [Gonioctena quinquepunctata]